MILKDEDLICIRGGTSSISGTFINSVVKFVTTIFEIGKTIGSSIRYKRSNFTCTN